MWGECRIVPDIPDIDQITPGDARRQPADTGRKNSSSKRSSTSCDSFLARESVMDYPPKPITLPRFRRPCLRETWKASIPDHALYVLPSSRAGVSAPTLAVRFLNESELNSETLKSLATIDGREKLGAVTGDL